MGIKSFQLCPNHVHDYTCAKDVEVDQDIITKELETTLIIESKKTGKPE